MKIKYLSHSSFLISEGGTAILTDPFFTGNPAATVKAEDIRTDYIFLSHAHGDHSGDTFSIAKANGATVISTFEIAQWCEQNGVKSHGLHIGGGFNFPFGRVKLTLALHGSSIPGPDGPRSIGIACGALITMGGKTVFHPGDTGLFLDMKLIGELNKIDVAMLPIGDNYTMDAADAAKAVEFLNPGLSIPMHFDTFDIIKADANVFADKVKALGKKVAVLKPGEEIEI